MSFRWLVLGLFLVSHVVADEQADRIAHIHVAAIGGEERLKDFTALRASGKIAIAGETIATTLIAQAPDRVWIETRAPGMLSTQGYNGKDLPWQFVVSGHTKTTSTMDPLSAREFIDDADFYDPLYQSAQRGITLTALDPITVGGKTYDRIRVTHADTPTTELWIDPETYLIVRQIRNRSLPDGRQIPIETSFSDFRPVAGILIAFRITSFAGGRELHETDLETVEANPKIPAGLFDIPSLKPTIAPLAPTTPVQ